MPKTSTALIVVVVLLLALGTVMLASTGRVKGQAAFHDPHYFIKRQALWLVAALVAGLAVANFDYHWLQQSEFLWAIGLGSTFLLGLVLLPGIGTVVGGSRRWLRLGALSFQPSELAKLSTVVMLSAWMARSRRRAGRLRDGLLLPLAGLAVVLGMILAEPDFGTTMLVGAVAMMIMFAGGTRLSYLAVTAVAGLGAFTVAVMHDEVRMKRIFAFLNPERHGDVAHQLVQSLSAFLSGDLLGVGLGNSIQKHRYLPEAHTDFILSIIGEELGFLATAGVLLLFLGLLVCGMLISLRAPDTFGRLLAFGVVMLIVMQAVINIAVVTGCLPTKGLPLPFISYGGSSLVVSLCGVGILLNVARHVGQEDSHEHTRTIRDRAHRV